MPRISSRQISGQIGIIVVLITAAILTFGLSVANRVVQESKVTVDRSDSIRVFNVAETGIDEALNQIFQFEAGNIPELPVGNFSDNEFNQVSIASSQHYTGLLNEGDNLRIDLNDSMFGDSVTIKWSQTACDSNYKVGLLLTLLHFDGTQYQNFYYLVGGDDCMYNNQQNFINAPYSSADDLKYSYNLSISPLYSDTTLYIQTVGSSTNLEVTGTPGIIVKAQYDIESLAKSEDDISNKAIKVERSLNSAPGFMTFALFSGGSIQKN